LQGLQSNHTSQVVMRGATLIVWIIGTMLVRSAIVAGMMMVDVIGADLCANPTWPIGEKK
jgi:hypothetical protein